MQDRKLRKILGVKNEGLWDGDLDRFVEGELPKIKGEIARFREEVNFFNKSLVRLKTEMLEDVAQIKDLQSDVRHLQVQVNSQAPWAGINTQDHSSSEPPLNPRGAEFAISTCCSVPKGFCAGNLAGHVKSDVVKYLDKRGSKYTADDVIIALCDMVITRDLITEYDKKEKAQGAVGQDKSGKEGDSPTRENKGIFKTVNGVCVTHDDNLIPDEKS